MIHLDDEIADDAHEVELQLQSGHLSVALIVQDKLSWMKIIIFEDSLVNRTHVKLVIVGHVEIVLVQRDVLVVTRQHL